MSASTAICPSCLNPILDASGHCACGACPAGSLPPVFLSQRDFGRLEPLARVCPEFAGGVTARFLAQELDRAIICRETELPDDVVTMRSRVLFRPDADRDIESRTLVYPEDYDPSGAALSVLSPLGVALLGLREGSAMRYPTLQGGLRHVVVEKVAWRPDGAQPMPRQPADSRAAAEEGGIVMQPSDTPTPRPPEGGDQDRDRVVVPFRPRPAPRRPKPGPHDPGPDPDPAA